MISKKIAGITAAVLAFSAFFASVLIVSKKAFSEKKENYDFKSDFFAMDALVSVRSRSNITEDISEIFRDYQDSLNFNDEKSETFLLNENGYINASGILRNTVSKTLELNRDYGGLTDITIGRLTDLWNITGDNPSVPPENDIATALSSVGTENIILNGNDITLINNAALDFGAVGKGAALDACLSYLSENDCKKTYISTGSSVLFYGDGRFDVSTTNPGGGLLAEVKTNQGFLSTSGGYERYFEANGKTYCHIIDPKTGYPAETDLTTVTVFCDSGIESDFLSTMIFLDGSENIGKYLNSDNFKIFAADKNKKLYISEGLEYEVYDETFGR